MKLRAPRSLIWHLSWSLAAQSLLGLALVAVGVYLVTAWSLAARQDETLAQRQRVVEHLLEEVQPEQDLQTLRHKLDDFFVGNDGMELWLWMPDGGLLYARESHTAIEHTRRADFEYPWSLQPGGAVRGALVLDIGADNKLLRRLAVTLLVSALVGAVLVSVAGSWVVQRGLRPLLALSMQIGSLRADSLQLRLDGTGQPQELQPVVDQFNALLGRLERAYAQLEAFNADVAHELRTPLAVLIGQSELALTRQRWAHELRDVIGANLEDLHRLSAIVNDMLFLSRADRGTPARRSCVPSIVATVNEVIEFHEAALHEAGLRTRVDGNASGQCDVALLRRALSNLLANATRYASPASTVTINIATPKPGIVQIAVSNVGPTIPPEHLPRLFDRFYRADAARERSDTNHGLGLAIVAAIARMHGGEAFADSAAGRTTVGLRWPTNGS